MRTREAILHELATEQAKLAELEHELSAARNRINSLNTELQTTPVAKPTALPLTTTAVHRSPATPADKVKLFRSLFRGHTDVFPVRFVSKKTGNPGYAPACSNKWEPGLCQSTKWGVTLEDRWTLWVKQLGNDAFPLARTLA